MRIRFANAFIEGIDVAPALADEKGNYAWLMRADTLEERTEQLAYVLERRR